MSNETMARVDGCVAPVLSDMVDDVAAASRQRWQWLRQLTQRALVPVCGASAPPPTVDDLLVRLDPLIMARGPR